MKPIIGCTTRPFGDADVHDIFQRIAEAGFSDVAVFGNIGIGPASEDRITSDIRAAADEAGLDPSMLIAHAEFDAGDPEAGYRRMIDHAAKLGAKWLLDLGTGNHDHLENYVRLMQAVAPYAESVGISITAKPHGGITTTADDLLHLHARVNHPAFGICFDPGNIIYYTIGEKRPETDVGRVAPVVSTGIIKDCVINEGEPDVMVTPGDGLVDFDSVLRGLHGAGFAGPLYLECVGGSTPVEIDANVRKAREYIDGMISDIY